MLPHPIALVSDLLQDLPTGTLAFDALARPLTLAAGVALGVERFVELLKNATDLFPGPGTPNRARHRSDALDEAEKELREFHELQATRERAERIRALQIRRQRDEPLSAEEREAYEKNRHLLDEEQPGGPAPAMEVEEAFPPGTIVVQDATDADDGRTLRALSIQLVAAAAGILAAHFFNVRLFEAFAPNAIPGGAGTDYVLTGLLIGGGSAPIHMLIRFIGQRKISALAALEREEAPSTSSVAVDPVRTAEGARSTPATAQPEPTAADDARGSAGGVPAAAAADAAWVEIPYEGGVDRERLESVHVRRGDPDTIIYHHTAMRRSSTFEDVVRVIKDRRDSRGNPWITGYNCVVTEDGVVHPFCRWDRYGNHAAGWNSRSLGIAINGNFESDPNVPWSNPDGRYGPVTPSRIQLDAAARVIALWTLIYGIPVDFHDRIIPHEKVSRDPDKTCPGGDFPYDRLRELVNRYHDAWQTGPNRARVNAFDRRHHDLLHI